MTIVVENLGKLERRFMIALSKQEIEKEVQKRILKLSNSVRMPGFRLGKVPLKMIVQKYGGQIETEVLSDQVGQRFLDIIREQELRVVGQPHFVKKTIDFEKNYSFDVTFEVHPEVKIGDLSLTEVSRMTTEITDAEIDRTLNVLRKQNAHYHIRGEASEHGDPGIVEVQNNDRVTVDFIGKIDGKEFSGGTAEDFMFVMGEGRMLPEFEQALLGIKVGAIKEFELKFPNDYRAKETAGKTATFNVTLKKIEWAHLPEVNAEFAKTLGIPNGDIGVMRNAIKDNLEREVERRTKALLKNQVMDVLISISEFDVPTTLVKQAQEDLVRIAREDLKQRGVLNADKTPIPIEIFKAQAERRVKLGFIITELVKLNNLQAEPKQIKAEVEEFAKSYEDPQEVIRWYYGDKERMAEIEGYVVESNVVQFVLGKTKVTEKSVSFETLAGNS
ncbi:trigger factor [Candidatus Pandoraea novymonadis]|uniref:Trigger factor n=1 Tax=Candidatus Pandoraea novymonadis TaxID=1808959 RepID=A0ABX5FF02_9BURK|nr:trigger factor [Candidatus Pandoraea novymonadis]PSB92286.1 Trigger factor [Candidatus Pandoraea novymonadis]